MQQKRHNPDESSQEARERERIERILNKTSASYDAELADDDEPVRRLGCTVFSRRILADQVRGDEDPD